MLNKSFLCEYTPTGREVILSRFSVTDEKFINIVENSFSLADVIRACGLIVAGGNYATIRNRIKSLHLDTSHFVGYIPKHDNTVHSSVYLSNKKRVSSHSLKNKLILDGYFEHKCCECGLAEWNNRIIPLELHHIDGDRDNNNIENITLLCPNCHALTDNYRGKNKKKSELSFEQKELKNSLLKELRICPVCKKEFYTSKSKSNQYKFCSTSCVKMSQRIANRPNKEELIELVKNNSVLQISKMYNVSDTTIRKWCRYYGFESSDYSLFSHNK